jgi:hypothetical protein
MSDATPSPSACCVDHRRARPRNVQHSHVAEGSAVEISSNDERFAGSGDRFCFGREVSQLLPAEPARAGRTPDGKQLAFEPGERKPGK